MIDYTQMFDDYGVSYTTDGPNTSSTGDWLSVCCPHCGDTAFHGAFNMSTNNVAYHCWRCSGNGAKKTLAMLLNVKNVDPIVKTYTDIDGIVVFNKPSTIYDSSKVVTVPGGPLDWYHRKYLESRKYDPDYLIREYGVRGTDPSSDYGVRVYFPVMFKGEIVSYQGRDIRENSTLRYLAAKPEEEKIPIKHVLFNYDNCNSDTIVLVEGVFDALRLGKKDVCATFGTSFKPEQLLHLKNYKRIFLLYDDEPEANRHAQDASTMITNISYGEVYNVKLSGVKDPDSLSDDDAIKLMDSFRKKIF